LLVQTKDPDEFPSALKTVLHFLLADQLLQLLDLAFQTPFSPLVPLRPSVANAALSHW
jgi:hypothetical protein